MLRVFLLRSSRYRFIYFVDGGVGRVMFRRAKLDRVRLSRAGGGKAKTVRHSKAKT